MRKNIEFKTEDGVTLRGWLYEAKGVKGPAPTVVMAHGFSAVKEMFLDDYAAFFAEAGIASLVYDHRNLGDSDGTPRGHIVPAEQISGYRDAISYAQTLPEVDPNRIGIWGSSYSGGHVLVVAAIDRRVKCVVAQVPLVGGMETARRLIRGDHWKGLREGFVADRMARMRGEAPGRIPVTGPEGTPSALPTADTYDFFIEYSKANKTKWENDVTLHSVELFTEYEPGIYIPRISPTPLLMVAALGDHLTPFDMTAAAFETALEPKKFLSLPCMHFEAYTGDIFKMSAPVQRDWFKTYL
ncbi:MAG: alpha/beta hydrolase [Parvibaculum sp.]|uniref:alpha/beta hydrolase n=1 Tax=Parvibaculum sp. TaxID=2024848 RepID=UPI0025F71AEA|nr:alpha/beta hydrolase [Parvibaculum sp.]MCE9648978.1 alpha/beta hydrolase [Parvibaculum sp.]